LGDEATLECPLQGPLPEPGGTFQIGDYLGFNFVHDGKAALDFRNDLTDLLQWWQREQERSRLSQKNVCLCSLSLLVRDLPLNDRGTNGNGYVFSNGNDRS